MRRHGPGCRPRGSGADPDRQRASSIRWPRCSPTPTSGRSRAASSRSSSCRRSIAIASSAPWMGGSKSVVHVPGSRLLVHPPFQRPEYPVYTLNERVIFRLSAEDGSCAVVMVAGWGVGNITSAPRAGIRARVEAGRVRRLGLAAGRRARGLDRDLRARFHGRPDHVVIARGDAPGFPQRERSAMDSPSSGSIAPPALSDREAEAGEASQTARGRGRRAGTASCSSPVSATPSRPTTRPSWAGVAGRCRLDRR